MAAKQGSGSQSGKPGGEKLVAANPSVRNDFHLVEIVEAGMMLTGTEIKSLRKNAPNLKDSFVEVIATRSKGLEAWLVNLHIAPYTHGNIWNHEPMRRRKLLLHRHQIDRLYAGTIREGMTVVPTRLYLKGGIAKLEIALAKGKKKHDRREDIKKRSAQREMDQAMKKRR